MRKKISVQDTECPHILVSSCTRDEIKRQHPFFGLQRNEYYTYANDVLYIVYFTHEFVRRESYIFIHIIRNYVPNDVDKTLNLKIQKYLYRIPIHT